MNIQLSTSALEKINDIAEFIDDINTEGAGDRWIERLFDFISDYANADNVTWGLCNNEELAAKQYSCITYNHIWVIAFKVEENTFKVYDFINGTLLH